MLKVSSFWRGFSWSTKLDSKYTSEEQKSKWHSFPLSLLCQVTWQILIHSDVQMSRYFSKVLWPHHDDMNSSWEECYLDFSPKICTYPTLVTIDALEVKIISILLYKKDTYFALLSLTIVYFLLLSHKKMFCVSLFSVKSQTFFINSNCFPFWKRCTVFLTHLMIMILYLSHHDVTAWHRPNLLTLAISRHEILKSCSNYLTKFISP